VGGGQGAAHMLTVAAVLVLGVVYAEYVQGQQRRLVGFKEVGGDAAAVFVAAHVIAAHVASGERAGGFLLDFLKQALRCGLLAYRLEAVLHGQGP
nr:hypothetical protein [Tanacetum cinerariifolium]